MPDDTDERILGTDLEADDFTFQGSSMEGGM